VAESILKQIPSTIPLKNDIESLVLEQNIEFFLFIIMSVQDIGLQEVNQVLKITRTKQLTKSFFKNLEINEHPKAKLIAQELKKSFDKPIMRFKKISGEELKSIFPEKTNQTIFAIKPRGDGYVDLPYWDSENSWRWEVNKLRNEVAHSMVLKRLPVGGLIEKTTLFFYVDDDNNDLQNMYEISNPSEYFTNTFTRMKELVLKIREILNSQI
jgi:hypothetical protein